MIIASVKAKITSIIKFVKYDIWNIDLMGESRFKRTSIKGLRTISLAIRGYSDDKLDLRASALTFYSVLSVVPVLAMIFGISKGFGFDAKIKELLHESLKGQEEVANWLVEFSGNMLSSVNGGWIFGIGLVFLLWTIMQVLGNIENSFNTIWQIKHSRVLFRKFSDYFSIMLIAPILIILSSSSQVIIIQMVDKLTTEFALFGFFGPILYFLVRTIPYFLIWLLFTFIYMVMPNTKVNIWAALFAGILAGTMFQVLQWGYIHFQVGVSRYNAIYGSFAALPLFLVWLNWSWLIVLFGAKISFSAQNHRRYEYESDINTMNRQSKNIITIYLTHTIVKNFIGGGLPLTVPQLSDRLKVPVRIVRHILNDLVACKFIAETSGIDASEPAYLPVKDIQQLTIYEIINKMESMGNDFSFIDKDAPDLVSIQKLMNEAREMINDAQFNKALKSI